MSAQLISTAVAVSAESHHQPSQVAGGKRWLLGASGLLLLAVGMVGVVLPGVPTTGPLLGASLCLAKSHPRWQRKILAWKFCRRYLDLLDGATPIPRRARFFTLVWMWAGIGGSSRLLQAGARAGSLAIGAMITAGLIGTAVILLIRRS